MKAKADALFIPLAVGLGELNTLDPAVPSWRFVTHAFSAVVLGRGFVKCDLVILERVRR